MIKMKTVDQVLLAIIAMLLWKRCSNIELSPVDGETDTTTGSDNGSLSDTVNTNMENSTIINPDAPDVITTTFFEVDENPLSVSNSTSNPDGKKWR